MKLDLIGIGAQKAGTTTLARLLAEHPGICMAVPKEVRFFNRRPHVVQGSEPDAGYRQGFDWYFRHFSHCGADQLKGEFSNVYLTDEASPERIHRAFPEIRLLLSVRDPVRRAWSAYRMHRQYGRYETRPFSVAVREDPDYVEQGLYFKHLQRYLKLFPRDQLHVIVFEDFERDPRPVVRDLYAFAGADPSFVPPSLDQRFNVAQGLRFPWLQRLEERWTGVLSRSGRLGVRDALKRLGVHRLVDRINRLPAANSDPAADDVDWLRNRFADDVDQLERFLGRKLDGWTLARGTLE